MYGVFESEDHSFPDSREFDIRKCCRMYANCAGKTPSNGLVIGTMNVWIPTSSGATVTLDPNYIEQSAQHYKISIPQTTGLRGAVSDRIGATNANLMAGQFEMDCTARVLWPLVGNDGAVPRIGFAAGHTDYFPQTDPSANLFNSCIAFTCFGSERTWFAHLSSNGSNFGTGLPFYEKRVNTNAPVDTWTVLHVWVRADGKQAKFYANGRLVHNETDPLYIPRRDNYLGASNLDNETVGAMTGDTLNNGGVTLRGLQTNPVPTSLSIDWVRTRYFLKR